MKKNNFKRMFLIIIGTIVVGSFFAFFLMKQMKDYGNLIKPILSPPAIVFPVAWTILYILMSISLYIITQSNSDRKIEAYIYYVIQILINSFWTLFFFGLKLYLFSFIWLVLLLIVVIIMSIKFKRINKVSFYLLIPYIFWLIFAGYLNLSVYLLN